MAVTVFGEDAGKTIAVVPVMSNPSISNVKCKEDTSPEYIRYFKWFIHCGLLFIKRPTIVRPQ
jgi:hypothetical protein